MDNPTISEIRRRNLLRLMAEKYSGRQAPLARDIGRKPDYIWRIVNEQKGFGEDLARKIEEILKLPPGWFDDSNNSTSTGAIPAASNKVVIVPPLDAEMAEGVPIRAGELQAAGGNPETVRALVMSDQAMSLTLQQGDLLIIDTAQVTPSISEIYAVEIMGARRVRRLAMERDGISVQCDTHDKIRFKDSLLSLDEVRVLGRVVWSAGKR